MIIELLYHFPDQPNSDGTVRVWYDAEAMPQAHPGLTHGPPSFAKYTRLTTMVSATDCNAAWDEKIASARLSALDQLPHQLTFHHHD